MDSDHVETADLTEGRWRTDIQRLFASPTMLLQELPGLADLVRGYLALDAPLRQGYADALLVAALAHGDMTEQPPRSQAERKALRERTALREGARGTLFLPIELDGDGQPADAGDERLVYGESGRNDTVTEHRRWAGLRFGRADVRRGAITPGTAAKWGTTFRGEFEARLISDLRVFLDDEQAQQDFVDSVIPFKEQSHRYRAANAVRPQAYARPYQATSNRLLLEQLAARLDEPSVAYPKHLTPTVLARELTLSPFKSPEAKEHEAPGLYASTRSHGGESLRGILARERRVVVVGNPGGGKSTVLAAEVLACSREGHTALMVRLSSVASRLERFLSFASALNKLAEVALEDGGLDTGAEDIERLVYGLTNDPNSLIALDGLDEIHADDLEQVWTLCRVLEALPGRVLISSRVAGYIPPPGDWETYSVDNLWPAQASSFIDSWFGDANQTGRMRALAALEAEERRELAEIPVLLGIVASVAEDDDVPDTEAALYDRYVTLFLRGKWKPRNQWLKVEDLPRRLQVARELAWQMATGFSGRRDGVRWSDTITYAAVIDKVSTTTPRLARQMVRRHGLFTPHGRSASELHQQYRWLHRTIHEHLVGAHLAERVRTDRVTLMLDDEILMGPTQWLVPLRHMMGLLDDDDQERVMERVNALRSVGDPGYVLDRVAEALAGALPDGSAPRRREAERLADRGNWLAVRKLDPRLWLARIPDAVRAGASDVGVRYSTRYEKHDPPPEPYVRDLLALAVEAAAPDEWLLALAIQSLVAYDPDGALDAVVAASRRPTFDPDFDWHGHAPTAAAVARALDEISTWPRGKQRFVLLYRIAMAGADLAPHSAPVGPLPSDEVAAVLAMAKDLSTPSAEVEPLEEDVHRALLSGIFGDEMAEKVARWPGSERIDTAHWGAAALLVESNRGLADAELNTSIEEDPCPAMRFLDMLSIEDPADPVQLRAIIAATLSCVRGAARVPIDWCLRTYLKVWSIYWDLGHISHAYSGSPLHTVGVALMRILVARPAETRRAVMESDIEAWVAKDARIASVQVLADLHATGILSVDDVVWLARWAAQGQYVILHTLDGARLGARVLEVAERLWAESPEVIEISVYPLAVQLAELGQLMPWRERLIAAERAFQLKAAQDESAAEQVA